MPLLSVRNLHVHFPVRTGILQRATSQIRAVDGVSFDLNPSESLGLVGESGCGKTTVGRAILRLIPPTAGSVEFDGADVLALRGEQLRAWRLRAQIIFQDPGGSLNPRMRVSEILSEPLLAHRCVPRDQILPVVHGLMDRCGLPRSAMDRFPHEFSGGQKQRIAIARALSLGPSLIVCDEPTSALDVSIQAQILNLLRELQSEKSIAYLFISHDIGVVAHLCHRVAVMQGGRIIESGPTAQVLQAPSQEYTRTLLAAVPGKAA